MIFATSDAHGYPLDSFLRLLEKAGFSDADHLYVIGDGSGVTHSLSHASASGVHVARKILSEMNHSV